MPNAHGRSIDKTHLSIDKAEERGLIHRDYLAHCHRWSHALKLLMKGSLYQNAIIGDIGCGKEMPLAKLLHCNRMQPGEIICIDAAKLSIPDQFKKARWAPTIMSNIDAANLDIDDGTPHSLASHLDVLVCFEMLEHIEPKHMKNVLRAFRRITTDQSLILISTPCYDMNAGAAGNHVNEITYLALGAVFEDLGFEILNHYGTFASIRDYEPHLEPAHRETFEQLRAYYDTNVLATIMAPLYPQYSRNCLWVLRRNENPIQQRNFPSLLDIEEPWGSSEEYKDLLNG